MFEIDEELEQVEPPEQLEQRQWDHLGSEDSVSFKTSSWDDSDDWRRHLASQIDSDGEVDRLEIDDEPDSPTTIQRSLCLNATSALEITISDSDDDLSPTDGQKKLCLCASINPVETQEAGLRQRSQSTTALFPAHIHPITDDYEVSHEIIGIGESGKVMACYKKESREKFALKVLRDGPKARREVELHWMTSTHDNVVSILDIYENSFEGVKCLLLVIEFLEGGDLLSRFEDAGSKPYTEEKVGEIIRQIGSAVQYLHNMNIAHRDIKLENILCSSKGPDCVYKLGDYGFAKRPERNVLMESPCCTPFYVPPEVLGRERYDKSCDMWSLGVAMYILLCGYPPFYSMKGLALSPGMRSRISRGYYAFPKEEWDQVSQPTKDDIKCLLRTDPSRRMTIDELMDTPLVRGQDAVTKPIVIGAGAPAVEEEEEEEEDVVTEAPPPVPRSVRFLRDGVKAPRLHSIQEEVGRVLEMMRLGNDLITVKNPRLSCNSLLRRRSANVGIPLTPA